MNGIFQVEVYDPNTKESQYTLIHLNKPDPKLTSRERQFVDYVRAHPGTKLSALSRMFSIRDMDNFLSSIEHKNVLFGEMDEGIEIIKENGVYKNE